MAAGGITVSVLSGAFSALAGAAVYHLVATTLERLRVKRALLIELHRNYETLLDAEGRVQGSSWDGRLHNHYQMRAYDLILFETPKLWSEVMQTEDVVALYERLQYLNDLKNTTLVHEQTLDRDETVSIIQECKKLTKAVFPELKREWPHVARGADLSLPDQ